MDRETFENTNMDVHNLLKNYPQEGDSGYLFLHTDLERIFTEFRADERICAVMLSGAAMEDKPMRTIMSLAICMLFDYDKKFRKLIKSLAKK